MEWEVAFGDEFDAEFERLPEAVQDELLASAKLLAAFDHGRKAILLVAGDKSGGSERGFYKTLIAKADKRFQGHLDRLAAAKKGRT